MVHVQFVTVNIVVKFPKNCKIIVLQLTNSVDLVEVIDTMIVNADRVMVLDDLTKVFIEDVMAKGVLILVVAMADSPVFVKLVHLYP